MLEVVKLFEDTSTIDELGVGSVRDTFSNALFPGTSTLHTRVKYFLFVPWLVNDVARHQWPVERSLQELRTREISLIKALVAGGQTQGVIGRAAQSRLKSMPSTLYWASLEYVGVRTWRTSIAGYFRNAAQHRRATDDPDREHAAVEAFGMVSLPQVPSDLLTETTFDLDTTESEYLRSRIAAGTDGTLFAWLATHRPRSDAANIWGHEARADFPKHIARTVDDARRVHYTASGPSILYNRMMAEVTGNDEARDKFAALLDEWSADVEEQSVFTDWEPQSFWLRMHDLNPRIRPSTRRFLDDWWALARAGQHDNREAQNLVMQRELVLKRSRARLTNPEARSTWAMGAGTGGFDFRWSVARSHLNDIAAGLGE